MSIYLDIFFKDSYVQIILLHPSGIFENLKSEDTPSILKGLYCSWITLSKTRFLVGTAITVGYKEVKALYVAPHPVVTLSRIQFLGKPSGKTSDMYLAVGSAFTNWTLFTVRTPY